MPTPAGDPLRKVTLNLYEADCAAAEKYFGRGWTTELRDQFHAFIHTTLSHAKTRRTLGDLNDTTK